MLLGEILKFKGVLVHLVQPQATLQEVLDEFLRFDIGSLVVCEVASDERLELIGIITERDILRALAQDPQAIRHRTAAQVMSSRLISASPCETLDDATALMTTYHIRHLPLIDADGLCGIVSMGDVVKARHHEVATENYYMKNYIGA